MNRLLAHGRAAFITIGSAFVVAALDSFIQAFGSAGWAAFDADHLRAAAGVGFGAGLLVLRFLLASSPYARPVAPAPLDVGPPPGTIILRGTNPSSAWKNPEDLEHRPLELGTGGPSDEE